MDVHLPRRRYAGSNSRLARAIADNENARPSPSQANTDALRKVIHNTPRITSTHSSISYSGSRSKLEMSFSVRLEISDGAWRASVWPPPTSIQSTTANAPSRSGMQQPIANLANRH